MKLCFLCSNKATFGIEGYAKNGWDSGFVYQPVCDEHVKSYYDWLEDDDVDPDDRIHGLEYIKRIDNVAAGDRIRGYTSLRCINKNEFVMEDEEWETIICNLEFSPIICNVLTDEQLHTIVLGLRERIYEAIALAMKAQ